MKNTRNSRNVNSSDRRSHKEIRELILSSLKNKQKSIHEIASSSDINWRTTELHLTFLKGKEYVNEVFKHHHLRIFELTKTGRKHFKFK